MQRKIFTDIAKFQTEESRLNIRLKILKENWNYRFQKSKSIILKLIHINPMNLLYIPKWIISLFKRYSLVENEMPWIPFNAIKWLNSYLMPNMVVFEYGSGGSTLFLSKRTKEVTSVEHDKKWFNNIKNKIERANCVSIKYSLIEDPGDYSKSINVFPDHYFNLVFIDGINRNPCIRTSINKIKPGGYLMLDNSELKKYSKGRKLLEKYKRIDFIGLVPSIFYICQNSLWKIE